MAPEGCLAMHGDPSPFAQADSCNPPVRGPGSDETQPDLVNKLTILSGAIDFVGP